MKRVVFNYPVSGVQQALKQYIDSVIERKPTLRGDTEVTRAVNNIMASLDMIETKNNSSKHD